MVGVELEMFYVEYNNYFEHIVIVLLNVWYLWTARTKQHRAENVWDLVVRSLYASSAAVALCGGI